MLVRMDAVVGLTLVCSCEVEVLYEDEAVVEA